MTEPLELSLDLTTSRKFAKSTFLFLILYFKIKQHSTARLRFCSLQSEFMQIVLHFAFRKALYGWDSF